jgi:hypothetical protein
MRVIGKFVGRDIGKTVGKARFGSKLNYEYDLRVYLNSLTTPLPKIEKDKLNDLIFKPIKQELNIELLSDAFDAAYLLCGYTAESSLKNIVKRAHDATAVNSPTYTQHEGWSGNGISSYINTNYNASTQGINFKQDDASQGGYVRQMHTAGVKSLWGVYSETGSIRYLPNRGSLARYVSLNNDRIESITEDFNDNGVHIISRLSSSEYKLFINNALRKTIAYNSIGIAPYNVYLLCENYHLAPDPAEPLLFSEAQLSFYFIGKGLTLEQSQVITNAIESYMDSNGKGVIV